MRARIRGVARREFALRAIEIVAYKIYEEDKKSINGFERFIKGNENRGKETIGEGQNGF